jgi:ABC-type transport system involved in multi-copper enzyme maturation permease subunit
MTLLSLGVILTVIVALLLMIDPHAGTDIPDLGNGIVRVGTVLLGGVLGLGAMTHTVNSVTREREKDTLDNLLTLPVSRDAILEAKWLGGLVSLRAAAYGLVAVWAAGVLTGGLHPLALLRLVPAVAAPVEFLASLGLWLSVVCRTSLRATMAAALGVLLVAVGPWIVANYVEMLDPVAGRSGTNEVVTAALMPVATWVRLAVPWRAYASLSAHYFEPLLAGSLLYAVAAWLLWRAAGRRFRAYGGRSA